MSNTGLPDGGVFQGYKFLDIQLLNTTNLDSATSSVIIEDANGNSLSSFNLAKTDTVQSFDLSGISPSNATIQVKLVLNHTTPTDLTQIDYIKVVGKTNGLVNTDLRVATFTVDGSVDYNRAEFTGNITVKNSKLKDVYVKVDMDKINGVLSDTTTDNGLFSDAKFQISGTNLHGVGSPLMFNNDADTYINGVAADISNLTNYISLTPIIGSVANRTQSQGYAFYKLGDLDPGFTTNFKIRLVGRQGIINDSTLKGAFELIYGDTDFNTKTDSKNSIETFSDSNIVHTNQGTNNGGHFGNSSNKYGMAPEFNNSILITASTPLTQNTDYTNLIYKFSFNGSQCIPHINSVTSRDLTPKVSTNLPQTNNNASFWFNNDLIVNLPRSRALDGGAGTITVFADYTKSLKADGTPCVPGTDITNSPKVVINRTVSFPDQGLADSTVKTYSIYLTNNGLLGAGYLYERHQDENKIHYNGGFPGCTEYYIASNPSNKGYVREG